jgi:hypothetical protein
MRSTTDELLNQVQQGATLLSPKDAGKAIDQRVTAVWEAMFRKLQESGWRDLSVQGGSFGLRVRQPQVFGIVGHMYGSPYHQAATETKPGRGREIWSQVQLPKIAPRRFDQPDILIIDHDARTVSFVDNTRGGASDPVAQRHNAGKDKYLVNPYMLKFRALGYRFTFDFPSWEEARQTLKALPS